MLESQYQSKLIKTLRRMFDGCVVIKNDPNYIQGFPDLLILWGPDWAALEVKVSEHAHEQPNQGWYVELLDEMSFAAFIHPGNEAEILSALQYTFESRRDARLLERQ
jgi:hypothetical protein